MRCRVRGVKVDPVVHPELRTHVHTRPTRFTRNHRLSAVRQVQQMPDDYPMIVGGKQAATGVHTVGGNAMGAPVAPGPAEERGKGRGSLRQKSAPEPRPTSPSSHASTAVPQSAQYLHPPDTDGRCTNGFSTLETEDVRVRGRLPKRSTSTTKRMDKGTRSRTNGGRIASSGGTPCFPLGKGSAGFFVA